MVNMGFLYIAIAPTIVFIYMCIIYKIIYSYRILTECMYTYYRIIYNFILNKLFVHSSMGSER